MLLLLVVSFIWAFSFGLIKGLSGIDPTAVAVIRSAISLLVFIPFFRTRGIAALPMLRLASIGALQFGAMYVLYLRSYLFLHAYQVALFTITTPVFVTLLDAAAERRWRARYLYAAVLSVAGAAVLVWRAVGISGVAAGDASVFALLYAGSLALTLAVSAFTTDWHAFAPSARQWATIVYLGAVASGLGFFLWNVGAARVNAGCLAAFNNAKIPLGIACSLLVFGESADVAKLLAGAVLMALGVWAAGAAPEKPAQVAVVPAL